MVGSGIVGLTGLWAIQQNQRIETYNNRFYPGTVVNGYSVEGRTTEEVIQQLEQVLNEQASISLRLKSDLFKESKTLEELGIHYSTTFEVLDQLEEHQQSRSWLEKVWALSSPTVESAELTLELNQEKLSQWLQELAKTYNQAPVEPTVALKWKENQWMPVIEKGQPGLVLEESLILERIGALPSFPWKGEHQVKATFTKTPVQEEVEALKQVTAPIGTWTSYFNSAESRATNVKRAAELIHNTLLMPGETFSYNEKVLPATADNGYVYGTIFVNGQKVPGMAGGICQVSSTLYNAVLEAGIKADERTNHSLFVDYVPYGQDATMNDSGLDFKFTNPYEVPILIQATTSGGSLTISLWSAPKVLKGLDYKAYTEAKGSKTYDTYLQAFNSEGKLVSSEFLHRSIYR